MRRSHAWIAALAAAIALLVYFGVRAAGGTASAYRMRQEQLLADELGAAVQKGAADLRAIVRRTRARGATASPFRIEAEYGAPGTSRVELALKRERVYGDDVGAIQFLSKIALETEDVEEESAAMRHIGRLQFRRGEMVDAVATLERAVALEGASPRARALARGALAKYRGDPLPVGNSDEALLRAHAWAALVTDSDQVVRVDDERVGWQLVDFAESLAVAQLADVLALIPEYESGRWQRGKGLSLPPPFPPVELAPTDEAHAAIDAEAARQFRWGLLPPLLAAALLALGGVLVWLDHRRREAFERRRRAFMTAVTHELKTPIANVSLYAETLREHGADDPERVPKFAGVILAEAERLQCRVQEVLDVASGKRGLPTGAFDVAEVVDEVIADYRTRGVDIVVEREAPGAARGSAALFQRALDGLLDNAAKFAGDGAVHVGVARRNGHIAVVVDDAGPGIPSGDRERVFEPFVRLTEDAIPGTGLGLTLVRQCVEDCGGTVTLNESARGGARVEIRLDVAHPAD